MEAGRVLSELLHLEEKQSFKLTVGSLICALISENQGLHEFRFVSNVKKISGPAHLDFFSVCHLDFSGLCYKSSFFSRLIPRKKSKFSGPDADLDFQKSRCRLKGCVRTNVNH